MHRNAAKLPKAIRTLMKEAEHQMGAQLFVLAGFERSDGSLAKLK
jgi:hypothetical protein